MKPNNITMYMNEEISSMIEKASEIVALNRSSFCRNASVEKAREILRKNQEEVQPIA